MPLTAPIITQAIIAAGPDLHGPSWIRLATVVGIAVSSWAQIPANLTLQGVTAGAMGSGIVTGKIAVTPVPITVPAGMLAAGLIGIEAASMGRAIGMGTAIAFNASALYQGASVGVGSGTDISKVTLSNSPSLVLALSIAASSTGMVGVNIPRLCAGIGSGIATLLLTGTGTGVVAGPTGPAPGSGTSLSRVF